MIEPQSMHDGASAWVANATLVPPRFSVIGKPPSLFELPLACPLLCPFEWPFACPFEAPTVARYPSSTFGTTGAASNPTPAEEGASRSTRAEEAFGWSAEGLLGEASA